MSPTHIALDAAVGLVALYWLETGWSATRGGRLLPSLGDGEPLPVEALPSLAIVATAKDEAARVERAARSLLAQNYPGARVLIVDDRSTDETGVILDRLAGANPRLRTLHVRTLPEGWIGKCHALALAAESCDSEWILFTDGDVTMSPDAARRAVSLAVRGGYDHVAVGAEMQVEGLGEAIFVGSFLVIFNASQRPWLASDPRRKNAVGVGAFNLVRRDAYVRAGGHARLKLELLDDMALAKIIKENGGRQVVARHAGLVHVRWHHGVRGLIRGVEKNAFPATRYNVPLTLAIPPLQLLFVIGPYAGLFLPGILPRLFALAAWIGIFLAYHEASKNAPVRAWQGLLMPVGILLFSYALLRSMVITLRQGGVRWRDTFYPLQTLKRGRVW
jgi:glycosyltransferase involved in cell wall biosynthesis